MKNFKLFLIASLILSLYLSGIYLGYKNVVEPLMIELEKTDCNFTQGVNHD